MWEAAKAAGAARRRQRCKLGGFGHGGARLVEIGEMAGINGDMWRHVHHAGSGGHLVVVPNGEDPKKRVWGVTWWWCREGPAEGGP